MNQKTKELLQNVAGAYGLVTFVFTFVEMGFEWLTFAEGRLLFIIVGLILTLFVTLVRNDIH